MEVVSTGGQYGFVVIRVSLWFFLPHGSLGLIYSFDRSTPLRAWPVSWVSYLSLSVMTPGSRSTVRYVPCSSPPRSGALTSDDSSSGSLP